MRAAILARVSDEKQAADDRNSLPAQLRAMRRRCADEGSEIVREFVAPGESASTYELDRPPVLRELVERARRREFDLLVFHESSRLARDEEMAQWLINRLEQWGVRLVNAASPIDYSSPEGRMFYGVEHSLNAYWRRKMGEHICRL